jgi:hypothetical protein
MSAKYPTQLYTERETENLPGILYDADKKQNLFSEDFQRHAEEIIAIETALGVNMGNIPTPPTKATGAEIDTGTNDTKFVTPKAIEDSNLARTSDIPTLPTKATGAELDTGTDDNKFATAKAINDSHNVPSVAPGTSGNVMTSDGTDWTSGAPAGGGGKPQRIVSTIWDYLGDCFYKYASDGGTSTVYAGGVSLVTTDTAGSRAGLKYSAPYADFQFASPSYFWTSFDNVLVGMTNQKGLAVMGDAHVGASAYTYSGGYYGFMYEKVGGTIKIYAVCGNNTTQTKTELAGLSKVVRGFAVMSATDIKYYCAGNLVATHTTNLPTGTPSRVFSVAVGNVGNADSGDLLFGPTGVSQDAF